MHVHEFSVWSVLPGSLELQRAYHMSARPASVFLGVRSHTDLRTGDGETFWQKWA